jgi:hypothetical protein
MRRNSVKIGPEGPNNLRFLFAPPIMTGTIPQLDNRIGHPPKREGYPGRQAARAVAEENYIR